MYKLNNKAPPQTSSQPRAGINWIVLDEQFKWVSGGFDMVGDAGASTTGTFKNHILPTINIPKNGYIYIYCSNESQYSVFFDNLQVIHKPGPILEGTHYYPFGLTMAGISSKAVGITPNKMKYNGKEQQSQEFSDGSGLELYDYGKRMLDPQIGRWHVLDPKADLLEMSSAYVFCYNNPIIYKDPNGELAILINGKVWDESKRGDESYWDAGIISAIKNSGIPNSSNMMFIDGDRHGYNGGAEFGWGKYHPAVENSSAGIFSNSASGRYDGGFDQGHRDFKKIISKLATDPDSKKITEKIQIYTHSRGAAFGAGYIDALLEMIKQNADKFADPNNVIDLVYNMASHQSNFIKEPGGLNAYSQDHTWDPFSGNDMDGLKGAFTSNETSPGTLGSHATASFVKDITAFTKAFAANGNNSEQLINDFIKNMQAYGIKVTVK